MKSKPIKVAFATCVQLGKSCIEEILKNGGDLELIITLSDLRGENKSGRVYLDDIALENGIDLLKIDNINDKEVTDALGDYDIDWLFIIGWSQIAKIDVLNKPRRGCIGIHPTLLPVGRGRASIPWAIIREEKITGVTMFKLDQGVDTGPIIAQEKIKINDEITATELYSEVVDKHIELIQKNWEAIVNDEIILYKQDETLATYWPGRKPSDGEIYSTMTMCEAHRLIRAVTHPYPGAFFIDGQMKYVIWSAKMSKTSGDIKLFDGFLKLVDYTVEVVPSGE